MKPLPSETPAITGGAPGAVVGRSVLEDIEGEYYEQGAISGVRNTLTHSVLIEQAAKWLDRQGCALVITDMTHGGPETADAIGWKGRFATLIECKASLADFRADAKKPFRRDPTRGMGCQRYYCTLRGLLKLEVLPEKWGLLEWDGKRMHVVQKAEMQRHEEGAREEIQLLISAMRRLAGERPKGVSVRCYTMESKSRATLGVLPNGEAEQAGETNPLL